VKRRAVGIAEITPSGPTSRIRWNDDRALAKKPLRGGEAAGGELDAPDLDPNGIHRTTELALLTGDVSCEPGRQAI
jgi:hypothetical protein